MTDRMQMDVHVLGPSRVQIKLAGRLDIAGADLIDLRFSALCGGNTGVLVDLSGVTFLASIGIRTLLLGAQTVKRRGGRFVLLNPSPDIKEVLEVSGVGDIMPVCSDVEEGLQVLNT
jgi:anti-anti-sigma factor